MKSRRKAREATVQALYQCDSLNDWRVEAADLFFSHFVEPDVNISCGKGQEYAAFSKNLVEGVLENLEQIDKQIESASSRWSLNRMSRVDRNILRLATYEIAFLEEIPANVSLNEAIEIAKRFSTEDSPMFINGVLDKIAKIVEADPSSFVSSVQKKAAAG